MYKGLEWAFPPQCRIGRTLDLAVRPKELRNVRGAGIIGPVE